MQGDIVAKAIYERIGLLLLIKNVKTDPKRVRRQLEHPGKQLVPQFLSKSLDTFGQKIVLKSQEAFAKNVVEMVIGHGVMDSTIVLACSNDF